MSEFKIILNEVLKNKYYKIELIKYFNNQINTSEK